MRNKLKNLYILIISTLISLTISEVAFRYFNSNTHEINLKLDSKQLNDNSEKEELYIVGVGESTMVGEPYETSFSLLDLVAFHLEKTVPDIRIRKQLVAGQGRSLGFLFPKIVESLMNHPSLMILYVGHNDFLGNFSHSQKCNQETSKIYSLVKYSKILKRIYNYYQIKDTSSQPIQSERSIIDYPVVCEKQWEDTLEDYREKVLSLAKKCQELKIPIIFISPVGNEVNFNPNRSIFKGTEEEKKLFITSYLQANKLFVNQNFEQAKKLFEELTFSYPNFADAWYRLGLVNLKLNLTKEAKVSFKNATENDGFPFRALDFQIKALIEARDKYGAILIDGRKIISAVSPTGLLDNNVFHDMQHPNIIGYKALAEAVAAKILDIISLEKGNLKQISNITVNEIFEYFKFSTNEWFWVLQSRVEWMKRIRYFSFLQHDRIKLLLEYINRFSNLCKELNPKDLNNICNSTHNSDLIKSLEKSLISEYKLFKIEDQKKLEELVLKDMTETKNFSHWDYLDLTQRSSISAFPLTSLMYYGSILKVKDGVNQHGGAIVVNNKKYAKGFAAHPSHLPSIIIFKPEKKFKKFYALLGINDSGSIRSSVECQVIVDDKVLYTSPILRWHQEPSLVEVDIQDSTDLILKCDPTKDGNAFDHVVWLNPSFD